MSHANRGAAAVIALSIMGLFLIYRGITNNIPTDAFGEPRFASRGWYIIAGVLMQIFPLVWLWLIRLRIPV